MKRFDSDSTKNNFQFNADREMYVEEESEKKIIHKGNHQHRAPLHIHTMCNGTTTTNRPHHLSFYA